MLKKSDKENTLVFVYNELFFEYRKAQRARKVDSLKPYRIEMYKSHLLNLQEIIREAKIKCTFKEL